MLPCMLWITINTTYLTEAWTYKRYFTPGYFQHFFYPTSSPISSSCFFDLGPRYMMDSLTWENKWISRFVLVLFEGLLPDHQLVLHPSGTGEIGTILRNICSCCTHHSQGNPNQWTSCEDLVGSLPRYGIYPPPSLTTLEQGHYNNHRRLFFTHHIHFKTKTPSHSHFQFITQAHSFIASMSLKMIPYRKRRWFPHREIRCETILIVVYFVSLSSRMDQLLAGDYRALPDTTACGSLLALASVNASFQRPAAISFEDNWCSYLQKQSLSLTLKGETAK